MKTFYIELNDRGLSLFKGGNIEIMIKPLARNPIKAKDIKEAEEIFYNFLNESIGTSCLDQYNLREVK